MLSASLIQLEYASKQWKSTFSYFQGRQLKSAIQKHLQPPDQAPISLRRSDGTLATDTMFSDTLHYLGGSPDYTPPHDFTERLLSHTPQCPSGTETQDIPDMTWSEFTDILHSANPRKAGGDDHTNTYLLSVLPPPPADALLSGGKSLPA